MTERALGTALSSTVPPPARQFTRAMIDAAGPDISAVILYGSQLHRASPTPHSAWDLVVIVRDYPSYHRAMHGAGFQQRAPWKMNLVARILPPYATSFQPRDMEGGMAKCLVISRDHFMAAVAPDAPDHLIKGRMVQHVEIVWAESEARQKEIRRALKDARVDVLRWAGPFLDETFDAGSLTRDMLAVSFAGELRPENRDRFLEVWKSQSNWLVREFGAVLEEQARKGTLEPVEPGRYRFVSPPGRWDRFRIRSYFFLSKIRGTLRWFKYIVTFNDWLTYIKRKAERRTGLEIELTRAERKWPLIFLWPKVFRVLRYARTHETGEADA